MTGVKREKPTYEQEQVEHDDKIASIGIDLDAKKQDMVVICDFDSMIHMAAHTGKDEEGLKIPDYTEEEYHIAEGVLDELYMKTLLNIEKYFNISHLYICLKGKNNFRYEILDSYKSNRPPSMPIVSHLHKYMVEKYDAIEAHGAEADDLCYSISATIDHQGIICTIDKDFNNVPSIIYNYKKDEWKRYTEDEAKYNFAIQMCTGDSGDCIPGIIGIGPKKAEKIVQRGMTDYQYLTAIYNAYKACYKDEAKQMMRKMYSLLKFYDIKDLPIKK